MELPPGGLPGISLELFLELHQEFFLLTFFFSKSAEIRPGIPPGFLSGIHTEVSFFFIHNSLLNFLKSPLWNV